MLATSWLLFASCNNTPGQEENTTATTVATTAGTDTIAVRSEIQDLENRWAAAMNAKDIDALMALYTENAISMPAGEPPFSGIAAIRKSQEAEFAAPRPYATIAFETMEVYPQGDVVTEGGKTMYKDASGNVTGSGKYMVVFEIQDGKYLCKREIFNNDSKK